MRKNISSVLLISAIAMLLYSAFLIYNSYLRDDSVRIERPVAEIASVREKAAQEPETAAVPAAETAAVLTGETAAVPAGETAAVPARGQEQEGLTGLPSGQSDGSSSGQSAGLTSGQSDGLSSGQSDGLMQGQTNIITSNFLFNSALTMTDISARTVSAISAQAAPDAPGQAFTPVAPGQAFTPANGEPAEPSPTPSASYGPEPERTMPSRTARNSSGDSKRSPTSAVTSATILSSVSQTISAAASVSQTIAAGVEPGNASITRTVNPKFHDLLNRNKDVVGWVYIDNTNIDYPVLYDGTNQYYISHDIDGKETTAAAIFLDATNSVKRDNYNMLLHGHNMKNGTMFKDVVKYKTESFFKDTRHRIVHFDTLYDDMVWEVFSVYIIDADKEPFYTNFQSPENFLDIAVGWIERSMFYPGDITLTGSDRILTLSTCSYETINSRTVVHARLIYKNGVKTAEPITGYSPE